MRLLIISTNRSAAPIPVLPVGACLVAEAAERAGHSVTLLDLMFDRDPFRSIEKLLRAEQFDVIGLSVRNIDNNDMQKAVFYIRQIVPLVEAVRRLSNARLILGGAALTVMPEEIMRALGIDCAVIGNGEATFCRLLAEIARSRPYEDLPGVAVINNGKFRLNSLSSDVSAVCSVPAYHRWLDLKTYRSYLATVPLQTKLGCQFHCVYCTYPKIEGETYRFADPQNVSEAVLKLSSSGLRDIEFVDNVFNAVPDHAVRLCESFIRSGVRARFQSVQLNPAYLSHELFTAMERAGFVGIGLTVESASDQVLQGLQKGFTARQVYRAADIVRAHRIPCIWIFLLGGPGETRETVRETLRFAEKNITARDAVFFNIGIRIYPGTALDSIARKQGVLTLPGKNMLAPVFYTPPGLDLKWVSDQVRISMSTHMNFMTGDSFSVPYLALIYRTAYRLGFRSPLWRYTRAIRRGLRLMGRNV